MKLIKTHNMAFKLRSHNTGSIPLHKSGGGSFKKNPFSNIKTPLFAIDPVIDPTKKDKEKKKKEEKNDSGYEEIGRNVTTRTGFQGDVEGTFEDTNIKEQRIEEGYDIQVTPGGSRTKLPDDEYIASLIRSGIGREEAVRRKLIDPKFAEQFPLLIDDRERVETTFTPNPPPENLYSSYDTGYAYNTDFGTGGKLNYIGRTDDPAEAMKIVQRGENVSARTNAAVQGLGGSQQQGGTSGIVDADQNNFQSEQGFVVGINNEENYDAYDNFGLGRLRGVTPYGHREGQSMLQSGGIAQEYQNAKTAILEKYRGVKDRTGLKQELQKLKDLKTAQIEAAQSGSFFSPEMKQKFDDSHDTIYERAQPTGLFTKPKGGGRSAVIATPSETNTNTTVDSGFLNNILNELNLKR
tara:strand:+ start:291 stop:1514 length:1224 start_codon:yes stop_codon:yes gene_type:complete